jgi:hypothetical protein
LIEPLDTYSDKFVTGGDHLATPAGRLVEDHWHVEAVMRASIYSLIHSRRKILFAAAGLLPLRAQELPTFSTDLKLVTVLATVTDRKGEIVRNLTKSLGSGMVEDVEFRVVPRRRDPARRVLLVHGTRTPPLMTCREAILGVAAGVPSFSAILLSESPWPEPAPVQVEGRIAHRTGRISVEAFWPTLENPLERTYYLSGPPRMAEALTSALLERGLPRDSVRTDAWE